MPTASLDGAYAALSNGTKTSILTNTANAVSWDVFSFNFSASGFISQQNL